MIDGSSNDEVEEQVKEWREEGDRGGNDKILSFFADVYVFSVHVVPLALLER